MKLESASRYNVIFQGHARRQFIAESHAQLAREPSWRKTSALRGEGAGIWVGHALTLPLDLVAGLPSSRPVLPSKESYLEDEGIELQLAGKTGAFDVLRYIARRRHLNWRGGATARLCDEGPGVTVIAGAYDGILLATVGVGTLVGLGVGLVVGCLGAMFSRSTSVHSWAVSGAHAGASSGVVGAAFLGLIVCTSLWTVQQLARAVRLTLQVLGYVFGDTIGAAAEWVGSQTPEASCELGAHP